MIVKHLEVITCRKVRVVRYDAWKYGGKELKRNFVDSVAVDLELDKHPELSTGLQQSVRDTRVKLLSWFWKNKGSLLFGLLLAASVAALWIAGIALATRLFTDEGFRETARDLIPKVGTVFGLALVAVMMGPKVLEGAAVTTETPAPEGADQFAKRFQKLVRLARGNSPHPLVVFIDELDRCAPADVVATLRDLKTFLDQPDCAFIVAADREVIVRALAEEVPQAKPVREDEPYYATPGAFLDKIFQHQIALPPLRARALTEFARALADAQDGGVWAEMRAEGDDCYERAIFALIPVHVRSPRRVKVLMNNFATNARIAQGRGVLWLERVHEIAVLTVLQTEFPSVISDLRRVPRLLTYLRGDEEPVSDEVREIAGKYRDIERHSNGNQTPITASQNATRDEIMSDDHTSQGKHARQNASETLRRQLGNYLSKAAASGIQDPRPDLLYLNPAANRDRLPDPKLGDAIDFASDTAPEDVVKIFDGQASSTLAVAIPLLVTEGDNASGLGRKFAYEAACRLIEQLEPDDLRQVADQTQPSLIAAVRVDGLSDDSLPGALLVAALAGVPEVIQTFFGSGRVRKLSADLLRRFTALLPHVPKSDATEIVRLLADRFGTAPEPLLTALASTPVDTARHLWSQVSASVVSTINELELPAAEPAEDAPAASTQQPVRDQGSQAEEATEPTGDGIALLERLMDTVLGCSAGESLVSDIFASFQTEPTSPILQWTLTSADRVVAPMSSSRLRARHALLGIKASEISEWRHWAELLPSPEDHLADESLDRLAASLVKQTLLPAFATSGLPSADLASLTKRVAEWSSIDDGQLAQTAKSVLSKMKWSDPEATEDLWTTKQAIYEVLIELAANTGLDGPIAPIVVEDLATVLPAFQIDQELIKPFVAICNALPPALITAVSERLDIHEAAETEHAAMLLLRLQVRVRCDGPPVPVSELLNLEAPEHTTAMSSAWLKLKPTSEDVVRLLATTYPFTVAALEEYARQLAPNQRTAMWIAAEKSDRTENLLAAIGRFGIGSEAVDHTRTVVMRLPREPERAAKVKRLRCATALRPSDDSGSVQRAAVALARDLLDRDVSGDLRSAAELMYWAGGAPYGTKTELRELFNRQVKAHKNSLTQTLFSQLEQLGLVSKKKSVLESIFGTRD